MFTLRKITNDGLEMNFSLGDSYTLVIKERSPKEFEDKMKDHPFYDKTYAFIYWKDEILPLYKNQKNYIVSENGTTYSNLTYK